MQPFFTSSSSQFRSIKAGLVTPERQLLLSCPIVHVLAAATWNTFFYPLINVIKLFPRYCTKNLPLCLIFTATLCGTEVKAAQSCPTLCNSMGYTVHGILQARILEWVAFPFSRGSSQPRDRTQVSHTAGGFFTNWATREAHEVETTAQTVSISYKQLRNLFLISEWESAWSLTLLS